MLRSTAVPKRRRTTIRRTTLLHVFTRFHYSMWPAGQAVRSAGHSDSTRNFPFTIAEAEGARGRPFGSVGEEQFAPTEVTIIGEADTGGAGVGKGRLSAPTPGVFGSTNAHDVWIRLYPKSARRSRCSSDYRCHSISLRGDQGIRNWWRRLPAQANPRIESPPIFGPRQRRPQQPRWSLRRVWRSSRRWRRTDTRLPCQSLSLSNTLTRVSTPRFRQAGAPSPQA